MLVPVNGWAIGLVGGAIQIASNPGICYSDPDVAAIGGENVIVFTQRNCVAPPDATAVAVRYSISQNMVVATVPLHPVAAGFSNAFARIASVTPSSVSIATGRQTAAAWSIVRIDTGAGLAPMQRTVPSNVAIAFDRFSFDCSSMGCGLGALAPNRMMGFTDLLYLGSDGSGQTHVATIAGETALSVVQLDAASHLLYTQPNNANRTMRYNALTARSAVLPPLNMGPNIISVAGARMQNALIAFSTDSNGSGGTYEFAENMPPIGPGTLGDAHPFYTDADGRGYRAVVVGLFRYNNGVREYFVAERLMDRSLIHRGSITAVPMMGGMIRVALESGRNHLGTGLMVYERDRAGGGREIMATRLQCTDSLDCEDGDPNTPDRCVAAGGNSFCLRNPDGPDGGSDGGEAGTDASITDSATNRDVPSSPDSSVVDGATRDATIDTGIASDASMNAGDATEQSDTMNDVYTALDGETDDGALQDSSNAADRSAVDASTSADSAAPGMGMAFGGGSCGCRTPTRGSDPLRPSLVALLAVASVCVSRRKRAAR
jgi:hypothetical protein